MFMFESNNGDVEKITGNIASNIKMADISLLNFTKSLKNSLTDIQGVINSVAGYNTIAANTARETMGSTRIVGNAIQKASAAAAENTLLVGKGVEDNIKLYGALNESMMRLTFFSDKQIEAFQILGFTANMSAAELATMATSFDTLGYTTDKTLETMKGMTKQARSYGLNVSEFMGNVNKNLKLMTSYNFKDGVKGLSNMVAQAQSLRIDMNTTVSLADKLMSPEAAIETAAGFQMLGGAIGKLGDPFQLLHMAQTDMEGLQDSVVGMAAASVNFNEKTGEFNIPVTEMYRLREAADLAGMSYQEMTELAMKAAQKTKKLDILGNMNSVPEEQKELIANMSKIGANGNLEITMPDGTVKKIGEGFNDLTANDYTQLEKMLDVNKMSELDVAKESMGYLNQIEAAQATLVKLTTLNLVKSGGFENFAEDAAKAQDLLTTEFLKREEEIKVPQKIVDMAGQVETQLKLDDDTAKEIVAAVVTGISTASDAISRGLEEALKAANGEALLKMMQTGWDDVTGYLDNIDTSTDGIFKSTLQRNNTGVQNVNEESKETLPRGNSGQEGNETIQRNNLSVSNLNTSSLNVNEPTTSAIASNSNLTVSGQVNLTVDNMPTSSVMTKEEFARYLINNPDAMATISSQLLNTNGTYGGSVTGGGMNS
jgi:hypothetical protein